jgi:hypothetical protein
MKMSAKSFSATRATVGSLLIALLIAVAARGEDSPAKAYLKLLRARIRSDAAQITQMSPAAEEAAKRITIGGQLLVTGTQREFAAECVERAGGLKLTQPLGDRTPAANDVILVGLSTAPDVVYAQKLAHWRSTGTQIIVFGHREDALAKKLGITTWIDCGDAPGLKVGEKVCPTDTVANLANLWAFTGELIAACTRRGKMPVVYESYGLPGGRERAEKLGKLTFHDDEKIAPLAAGVLAKAYYQHIDDSLKAIEKGDGRTVEQIASWVATAGPAQCTAQIIGHIFPLHCQDPRAPQIIATLKGELATVVPTAVVLHIGYQKPPTALLDAMAKKPFKFFYSAVDLGPQLTLGNLLRFNPQWPLADACVDIPGYDVPALPESGVINAAIYWSIVSQASMTR